MTVETNDVIEGEVDETRLPVTGNAVSEYEYQYQHLNFDCSYQYNMRIRRKQSIAIRSRRTFGFDGCGILMCYRRACGRRRGTRQFVVSIAILVGVGLTTTLTPSQQLQYVNWESSLLNTSTEETTTPWTNDPDIVIKWGHWRDIERIVDKMWGGSLFCQTIKERLDQYYNETKAAQMQLTTTGSHLRNDLLFWNVPVPNVYVHFEFSCSDLYKYSKHGTGNYIQAIYFMRLVVKSLPNVQLKLNVTCVENEWPEFYTNYVLPWFTGVWYTPTTGSRIMERIRILVHTQSIRSYRQAIEYDNYCGSFKFNPAAIMYREMQYDVRRMAIALVGTQPFMNGADSTNAHRGGPLTKEINKFLHDYIYEKPLHSIIKKIDGNDNMRMIPPIRNNITLKPMTPQDRVNHRTTAIVPLIQLQSLNSNSNIVFDDAVIHFRCGDVLTTDLLAYGFLTFHGYSRHISSSVRSIGILTQPFGKVSNLTTGSTIAISNSTIGDEGPQEQSSISNQERSLDSSEKSVPRRCRTLVYAFQDHLQERFPDAKINIHNNRTETVALAYVRMVMAKQVVGSLSTFSIYPIIGTFGTGYYLRPGKNDPSFWAENKIYPVKKIWDVRTVIFDERNKLLGRQTKDLWDGYGDDAVLQWFRTGTVPINFTVKN